MNTYHHRARDINARELSPGMDGRNGLSGPSSTGVGGASSKSIIPAPSMSFTSPPPPGRPTTCQKERPKPTPATPKKKSSAHPHIRGVKSCPGLCPAASQAALQAERKRPTKTQSPVQLQHTHSTIAKCAPISPHVQQVGWSASTSSSERERKQDLPDLPVSAPRNTTNNHVQKHAPRLSSLVPPMSHVLFAPCPRLPTCPCPHFRHFRLEREAARRCCIALRPHCTAIHLACYCRPASLYTCPLSRSPSLLGI
ncbi:hypothetical protein BKA56DRAFT_58756 [Ilyonectria sp. MPI-CAGE-AT-0026]|nr:hypothetical protein BKA56DRAFT_58756 [Ilyonectria sp. MPI-CAGE-AT-0026]